MFNIVSVLFFFSFSWIDFVDTLDSELCIEQDVTGLLEGLFEDEGASRQCSLFIGKYVTTEHLAHIKLPEVD